MTSQARSPIGEKIGLSLVEFSVVYYALTERRFDLILASPQGGMPPIDLASNGISAPSMTRLREDWETRGALSDTLRLEQIVTEDVSAVIYLGGAGALWDLPTHAASQAIIRTFLDEARPLGLIGQGVAALCWANGPKGQGPAAGRRLTSVSRTEQTAMGALIPFCVADELRRRGGVHSAGPDGAPLVVRDGALITGQNAASALGVAQAVIEMLDQERVVE